MITMLAFALILCWFIAAEVFAVEEEIQKEIKINYPDKTVGKTNGVAVVGATYTFKVLGAPDGSKYEWEFPPDENIGGIWAKSGSKATFTPDGTKPNTKYSFIVKVSPPGEGGGGEPWQTSGSEVLDNPIVTFSDPGADVYIPEVEQGQNYEPVDVVAKVTHDEKTLPSVTVNFKEKGETSIGTFNPSSPKTGTGEEGSGIAATEFTPKNTAKAGDSTILQASCGATVKDGPKVTILGVEIDISETVKERDDFIPVGDAQPTKARLLGPPGFSKSITFTIDPASKATVSPSTVTMTVGTDVNLSITGVATSSEKNDTKITATIDNVQLGEEDCTVYDIELQINDGENWVGEIDAVAGDRIKFRTLSTPDQVRRDLNYAWDWNHRVSDDSTDADKDGIDEKVDDTESTNSQVKHKYKIPPYSHTVSDYTITQNTWVAQAAATDTGEVKIYEAHVTNCGFPHNKSGPTLSSSTLKYRVDYDTATKTRLRNNLFKHNIFTFNGHGSPNSIDTCTGRATYQNIKTWRKNHKTPEGSYRRYKFVELDCCHCGEKIFSWKSSFYTRCIWAWRKAVGVDHAKDFDEFFWQYVLAGNSASRAFKKAEKKTRNYYSQYPPGSVAKPVISGNFRFQK